MLMGTGSDVGKSLIAAGLCRHFSNRGMKVRPFKPQNMSNNAAVTVDGGEIGRAQALQAVAARADPTVHMNPVLLKPETANGAQLIVQGRREGTHSARDYMRLRSTLLPRVLDSFHRLAKGADLIIVEGAGSPAETNLRDGDIANLGFAEAAQIDALLVGDIHRGGVIASIVGTFAVLDAEDARRLSGVLINNFHGDASLFDEGRRTIERMAGRPVLGVVPHFAQARVLPAEDVLALEHAEPQRSGALHIAVLRLPRIANFDYLDPLRAEPQVTLTFVREGEAIPASARLVIIPGSKSTLADLRFLKAQGWDIDLQAHVRRSGRVLGICGGYQMLGRLVQDPHGIEGGAAAEPGLALLDVETTLTPEKRLAVTYARHCPTRLPIIGYEIHLGTTSGSDCTRPFAEVDGRPEGAVSADRRVEGTYLHGCFTADAFRRAYLAGLGGTLATTFSFTALVDETLDALARHLAVHADLERLLQLGKPVAG
ncbi:MAG: cobyric acid synthase [Pseudomonadota bacterium]|nr:cobyric acid synthase [Pseudomonadota bacterium]